MGGVDGAGVLGLVFPSNRIRGFSIIKRVYFVFHTHTHNRACELRITLDQPPPQPTPPLPVPACDQCPAASISVAWLWRAYVWGRHSMTRDKYVKARAKTPTRLTINF